MTTPLGVLGDTAVSTPRLPDEAAVIALNIPGEVFVIRPGEGQPEALITRYDLSRARIGGNPVSPVWSNPQTVIGTYGLGELVETCTRILRDLFGTAASVRPDIGQVAGRAYYGAYLVTCREICRLRGINPPQNFDHETLCHTLAGFRDDEQVRKFGTLLDGLRQRRVHADYHMSPEMYDGAADDAIDDARSALGMLPVVVARFPRIDPRPPRH